MAELDPFRPDDDYCVYCNAPAAGMCAECGALCCPACVDLVMGWTTRRAVCTHCLSDANADVEGAAPARRWRLAVAATAVGVAVAYLLTL